MDSRSFVDKNGPVRRMRMLVLATRPVNPVETGGQLVESRHNSMFLRMLRVALPVEEFRTRPCPACVEFRPDRRSGRPDPLLTQVGGVQLFVDSLWNPGGNHVDFRVA